MACTPELNLYAHNCNEQHCYDDCFDSGYSGLFCTPHSSTAGVLCSSSSPGQLNETPKENLRLSTSPDDRTREPIKCSSKDQRGIQRPPLYNWCETPKRDSMLRHRLLLCRPTTDTKTDNTRSQCARRTGRSEHWLSASFSALDTETGALTSGTLEQDLPLCSRKRRLLFTQVRTSTREDGKPNSVPFPGFERRVSISDADFIENIKSPCFRRSQSFSSKENSRSPVGRVASNLDDNSAVMCTPSSTQKPRYIRSVCEDSGFGSLTLDKSQDSASDHDGSFQELLLSDSRGNCETPNLAETKRRPRLQRQHRLSTLKEGGSQSEEEPTERRNQCLHQLCSLSKEDEVFGDENTACGGGSAKCSYSLTSIGLPSAKQVYATPLRAATTKLENKTPLSSDPLTATPESLSLTPALQLVHAMCQQNAQMFAGQSPSLKEQLKSTAALSENLGMFRTTMPLAGLIGRKMGLGKIDILTELKKRNLRHILGIILSHLSSESIYRCGQVCKSWDEIIQQDKRASFRRRNHQSKVEAAAETGGPVHVPDAETRLTLSKRSALKVVQSQSRSSSFCTPQSGKSTLTPLQRSALNSGSSSKSQKFFEVAKTLFNDESLRPCPRCQNPARCHSVKQEGVCSGADCGFQFCTACLYAFHGSKECGGRSAGRHKKETLLPGSAQSKRNIRRL